ncbi:hypothetical protein ODY52_06460, partial [Aerococcus sp. JJEM-2022c]|uniref:hypothetical protein n=1 Tax=Aerococcus sp. Group 2 TaxID=2976811 RepID=UPI00227AD349
PWLFVYQKMVPMKSRWLPSTPNIIEPLKRAPGAEQAPASENGDKFSLRILTPFSFSGLAL